MKTPNRQHVKWARKYRVEIIAVVISIGVLIQLENIERAGVVAEERAEVGQRIAELSEQLRAKFVAGMQLVRGLRVQMMQKPGWQQEEFAAYVDKLLEGNTEIRHIAAAEDYVIRYVAPVAGNQEILGLDYRRLPKQLADIETVMATGSPVITDIVALVQGGTAIIGRVPYTSRQVGGQTRSGVIAIVWRPREIFQNISEINRRGPYRIAIRQAKIKPPASVVSMVFGDASVFEGESVRGLLTLEGNQWELGGIPAAGWASSSYSLWAIRLGGLLVIVLSVGLSVNRKEKQKSILSLEDEIVRRRAVESDLKDSDRAFRSAVESIGVGIIIIGEDGAIIQCNPFAEELLGYTGSEMVGRNVSMLMPAPDSDNHDQFLRAYRQTGKKKVIGVGREVTVLHKNGTCFPAHLTISEMIRSGQRRFVGALSDLSDIRFLESGERARQARVSLFTNTTMAIVRSREFSRGQLDDVVKTVAKSASRVMAVGRVSVWQHVEGEAAIRCLVLWDDKAKSFSGGHIVNAADYPLYFDVLVDERVTAISDIHAGEKAKGLAEEYLPSKDIVSMLRSPVHVSGSMSGVLCFEHGGEPREWKVEELAFCRSMSDLLSIAFESDRRRKSESALEESVGQVRQLQKMDALGQLTGGVAHDFNNLLAVIKGNLEMLSEDLGSGFPWDPKEFQDFVGDALDAAGRGAELTHRLLAFSRKQPLQPMIIDVYDVVKGTEVLLRRTLGEGVVLNIERGVGDCLALADRSQLESVILNLAVNARDAMKGDGVLTITIEDLYLGVDEEQLHEGLSAGDYVMLTVSDNGEGMTLTVLEHLFEPFYTTKDAGKGTGLGLSIAYGFARQSDGCLEASSEAGKGSTFRMCLPRAEGPADELLKVGVPTVENFNAVGNETIIVVEDESSVRRVAVRILERLGYKALQAADGAEATRILESEGPVDLLLTDVVMPGGMSGPELVRTVKASMPEIKILYMSGNTLGAMGKLEVGAQLIDKPFSSQQLARKIREVLLATEKAL